MTRKALHGGNALLTLKIIHQLTVAVSSLEADYTLYR